MFRFSLCETKVRAQACLRVATVFPQAVGVGSRSGLAVEAVSRAAQPAKDPHDFSMASPNIILPHYLVAGRSRCSLACQTAKATLTTTSLWHS